MRVTGTRVTKGDLKGRGRAGEGEPEKCDNSKLRGRVRVGNDDEHMEGENGKRKKRKKANGKERGGDGKRMTRIRNR